MPINSTSIHVEWKSPKPAERNGVIRGYHIHVQEVREEASFHQSISFYLNVLHINRRCRSSDKKFSQRTDPDDFSTRTPRC